MISDDDRALRLSPNGARGQTSTEGRPDESVVARSSSTFYHVPVRCPECGKTVEAAELPSGAIIYIGTLTTTLGERYRRYDAGKERLPLVIRTRNMAGYPRHTHASNSRT